MSPHLPRSNGGALVLRDEEYPPLDGVYQNRTYGRRLSLRTVEGFWKKTFALMKEGKAPSDVGLYIHWPFCRERCAYCYCDMRVAKDPGEPEFYLTALLRETESFAKLFRGRACSSLILAGGTPTSATGIQLDRLLGAVRQRFDFTEDADIAVEATPATLTEGTAAVLARHGVRRVDMGVDSLAPSTLRAAGRTQDREMVGRAAAALASEGIALEIGLIYGIERQTYMSFLEDLNWVLKLKPAAVRLYSFDPRPQTLYAERGQKVPDELRAQTAQLFEEADERMRGAGYGTSKRMWKVPFSYLGLGYSAKSKCFGAGWYQHPPVGRSGEIDESVPSFFGMPMSLAEEKRGLIIGSLATLGRLPRDRFKDLFGRDVMKSGTLSKDVGRLADDGVIAVEADQLRIKTSERSALKKLYGAAVARKMERTFGPDWDRGAGVNRSYECRVYFPREGTI